MHWWVESYEELHDSLVFAMVYCPDFPVEDYLEPSDQLDLEKAFEVMSEGVKYLRKPPEAEKAIRSRMVKALDLFRSGNDFAGSHALQDLREDLFGPLG